MHHWALASLGSHATEHPQPRRQSPGSFRDLHHPQQDLACLHRVEPVHHVSTRGQSLCPRGKSALTEWCGGLANTWWEKQDHREVMEPDRHPAQQSGLLHSPKRPLCEANLRLPHSCGPLRTSNFAHLLLPDPK